MSIYKSSIDAYRDTTKWLAAFTPVTAILAAVVVTGAPVGESLAGAVDVGEWLERHWLLVACGAVIILSVGSILWWAARVLSVEPKEVVKILDDETPGTARAVETAFGQGMLAPDFLTKPSFTVTMQNFYAALEPGNPVPDERERLVTAFESLREWHMFIETRRQFRFFLIALGLGAVLTSTAIAVALTQVGTGGPIAQPTLVTVIMEQNGEDALERAVGCTDPDRAVFHAVGGTWGAPTLGVTGDGCVFAARWTPAEGQAVVLPAP